MFIIYVKTIFKVYKKPYTGFTWSLGATNGINYWIFILGSGRVDLGWTQVRHWTHWLTQGLTLGQMVLSSQPDPIWPGQLGSGRRSTRVKRVLTWPAATLAITTQQTTTRQTQRCKTQMQMKERYTNYNADATQLQCKRRCNAERNKYQKELKQELRATAESLGLKWTQELGGNFVDFYRSTGC